MEHVSGKRIFVGLSGGVDSAVTAALLTKAGADVTGVFIKGWYPPNMPCTWARDRKDAMRVAARLQIPFVTFDASEAYKKGVIDYLIREYGAGRTPNPDIMCNREVKFGAFFSFARENGAGYIATGHYARAENGHLYRGVDESKDQSYFLWAIEKKALLQTLFPLGDQLKTDTRALARKFNLPVASKRDSQGICFLGNVSVEDFLIEEFGTNEGDAIDEHGATVGVHNGVLLHTIGERITLKGASAGPWYVVRKHIPENKLVVSTVRNQGSNQHVLTLSETNWFIDHPEGTYTAQYRYHGPRIEGTLEGNRFTPTEPFTEVLAEGQSLVLYDQDRVIGGGIIE